MAAKKQKIFHDSFTEAEQAKFYEIIKAFLDTLPESDIDIITEARREQCARYLEALKLIARFGECENYTSGLGSCYRWGRHPDAKYSSQACCYPCIADAAIKKGE